jgi:hypothetical protein
MQEHQNSNGDTQKGEEQDDIRDFLSRPQITRIAIAVWVFVLGFFLLRLYIYDHIPTDPERTKVLVESMFSLALGIVIAMQAAIYFRQAKALDAQQKIMQRQHEDAGLFFRVAQQSYVGVHSIADRDVNPFEKMILIKLENTGRVPADEIRVRIHLDWTLVDKKAKTPTVRDGFGEVIDKYYGRTKLFPGRLKIEIPLPYSDHFSGDEITLIMNGQILLSVWGRIIYKDGFGDGNKTEFSFHHVDDGRWLIHAPWPEDIIQIIEESREDEEAHDPD